MKFIKKTAKFIMWAKRFFREDRPKLHSDIYYMTIAFNISRRSIDPHTVHGAVIVDKNGRILSTGYNGPIKKCDDHQVPVTRPEKYMHFLHAEENSIINYYGSSQDIEGSTIYITGYPCSKCLRMVLQKGVKKVVFAPIVSKCVDEEDVTARKLMLEYQREDIEFRQMTMLDMEKVIYNMEETIQYMQFKLGLVK